MNAKNKQNKILYITVLVTGIVAVVGIGILAYFTVVNNTAKISQPVSTGQGSENADVALEGSDETTITPAAVESYTVANDAPRILKIDSLGISAKVRPMGVNSAGAVQAPVNIYDSGWYTGSSKPGESGAMFIDAHASGATRQGLFAYLDTMKNGNIVSIERGDGQILTYKVVHVEEVPKDQVDMSKALKVYGDAQEGLNLMTCTGKWIESEKTYDNRAIVYTERIS